MEINQYTSLVEAINGLKAKGYDKDFNIDDEGKMYMKGSEDRHYAPEEIEVIEFHRLEGSSDPGDMSIVYALEVGSGEKGILIDMFGTYSNAKVSEFFKKVSEIKHNEH
jgi:hypothetical protein